MHLCFLEASVPLTKTFTMKAGALTKQPYPFIWEFTSHIEDITTLQQMHTALVNHASLGHCLLKGTLHHPLVNESRAGSTVTGDMTEFIVFDLDGLDVASVDDFLLALGVADVSHIVQWSASQGISDKLLHAHIIMLLDRTYAAPLLKQYLIQKNHEVELLSSALTLTKTGNSIRWPLDISASQNDKLIYIAPPVLRGLKDPMGKNQRIQLNLRGQSCLKLSGQVNSTDKNRELTNTAISRLREAAGLPKRKITYKMHGTTEVMVKPDACVITEMKTERGFVYFNLNGGDSWAYYHPENSPDFIYSFKGEPAYLTKELLPDYWEQLHSTINSKVTSQGILKLAFLDRATSTYWRGSYDTNTDTLTLHPAKNETQIRHFAKQTGTPLGDFIPEWDITFDPKDNVRVDPVNRTINLFQPTSFMLAQVKKVNQVPKTILKVMDHALGGSPEVLDHFLNWLAFILQERDRTKTAWVLHGTHGTGKGLLCNDILRPVFGQNQTAARRMEELDSPYNHFMRNSFLVFVDEVQTKALQNERSVMAKLKNFITEPMVPVRMMYANAIEARNYTNWLFLSNMSDPVSIDKGDRRFNVASYQPHKLVITDKEIATIPSELQAFHDYLMSYAVDADRARTVLQNQDRDTMISISESSIDSVCGALLEGNFEFFIDQLPTSDAYKANAAEHNRVENYRDVLKALLERTDVRDGGCSISRDELRTLADYTVGGMPSSPNKFTSLLKHHRIHISAVWVPSKTVNGIKVVWQDAKSWPAYRDILIPPAPKASKVVPLKRKAAA